MAVLDDLNSFPLRQTANVALTTAGLAATGGATATFTTGATAITFVQNGVFKSLAQQAAQALSPATANAAENAYRGTSGVTYFKPFVAQPDGTTCLYVVAITPAGTGLGVFQGGLYSNTQIVVAAANSTTPFMADGIQFTGSVSYYHNQGLATQTQNAPYPPNSTQALWNSDFLPVLPSDSPWVPVGVIKIINAQGGGAATPFNPYTQGSATATNWNTAGVTPSFANTMGLPTRVNL